MKLNIVFLTLLLISAARLTNAEVRTGTDLIGEIKSISVCNAQEDAYQSLLEYVAWIYSPNLSSSEKDIYRHYGKLLNNGSENFFYSGLTIPNHNQWIGVFDGEVAVEGSFAKTRASQILLDDYIEFLEIFRSDFCSEAEFRKYWDDELLRSPHLKELEAAGFNTYPKANLKIWIVPDFVSIEGDYCKALVTNKSLNVKVELTEAWLEFDKYGLRKEVKEDLTARLENWKQIIRTRLSKQPLGTLINSDSRFHETRSVFISSAFAHWYKELNSKKIEVHYSDSESLLGIEKNYFNKTFYEQKVRKNTKGYCDVSGGISFAEMPFNISVANATPSQLFYDVLRSRIYEFDNKTYFQEAIWFNDVELKIIAMGFSDLTPQTGVPFNISVAVENQWWTNASGFTIAFFDNFSREDEHFVFRIGETFVPELSGRTFSLYNITWNSSLVGTHQIYAIVDYYNQIPEVNERNNIYPSYFKIDIVRGNPEVSIYSPRENEAFSLNKPIHFSGDYSDDDYSYKGHRSFWTSNIDGYLSDNDSFTKKLSVGNHVISFIGIDDDDQTTIRQIPIQVFSRRENLRNITRPSPPIISKSGSKIVINKSENGTYEYLLDFDEWKKVGNSTEIDISDAAEGLHYIFARIIDEKGFISEPSNLSFYSDNTKPFDPVLRHETFGRWTSDSTPLFYWEDPGDIGSGVNHYVVGVDNNYYDIGKNQSFTPCLETGNHLIEVAAVDRSGLQSNFWQTYVYIDTTPPKPPELKAWHITDGRLNINWTEPEDQSGVIGYYFLVDRKNSTHPTRFSGTWTNDTSTSLISTASGQAYFHIIAVDKLGNMGEPAHYPLTKSKSYVRRLLDFFKK